MSLPNQTAVAMATPIQAIPVQQGVSSMSDTTAILSDPIVSNVLNDMEKSATATVAPNSVQAPMTHTHTHTPQVHQPMLVPPTSQMLSVPPSYASLPFAPPVQEAKSVWIHVDNLKQVGLAMVLSFILFQPNFLLPSLYNQFQRISFLRAYDLLVRVALFGMLLYVVLTYVPIIKS